MTGRCGTRPTRSSSSRTARTYSTRSSSRHRACRLFTSRAGNGPAAPALTGPGSWYVTFYLEPEVERDADSYEGRDAAVEGAVALATRFADGELDYRSLYQVPREAYLDKLDDLTGRT